MFDVAVIGAGMAGLSCAQRLRQAGYSVAVVEKSRGAGGRVATRRVQGPRAAHGGCYLAPQGGGGVGGGGLWRELAARGGESLPAACRVLGPITGLAIWNRREMRCRG